MHGVGEMIPITIVYAVEQPKMASNDCARARLRCLRRENAVKQRRKNCVMIYGGHCHELNGEISTGAPN